jgi:hypothetical protein
VHINLTVEREQRDGAIHQPGIDEVVAQGLRDAPADGALARSDGPVDGDGGRTLATPRVGCCYCSITSAAV